MMVFILCDVVRHDRVSLKLYPSYNVVGRLVVGVSSDVGHAMECCDSRCE